MARTHTLDMTVTLSSVCIKFSCMFCSMFANWPHYHMYRRKPQIEYLEFTVCLSLFHYLISSVFADCYSCQREKGNRLNSGSAWRYDTCLEKNEDTGRKAMRIHRLDISRTTQEHTAIFPSPILFPIWCTVCVMCIWVLAYFPSRKSINGLRTLSASCATVFLALAATFPVPFTWQSISDICLTHSSIRVWKLGR